MKISTVVLVSICVGLVAALSACAVGPVACQVIKAADDVCTVIDTVGADGQHHQVPVTPRELQGFARTSMERRAAEQRAGVPMGAELPKP